MIKSGAKLLMLEESLLDLVQKQFFKIEWRRIENIVKILKKNIKKPVYL